MLTRPPVTGVTIWWNDKPLQARPDDSIAVALLAGGVTTTRTTAASSAPRGPYCMMGACFECLAEVDGRPNVQTCMTQVQEGMHIRQQSGAKQL